ncbi:MAG: hypothetical protein EZS28_020915 [Streblomastix strix]|uniref:TmcB/TmcC TPR repeats domain-containing protein n=1 Tax=Streblomastix strix TaxID=222440 RepID=A0A5J4VLP0_9EUKA|nr:MAG: hypothetical protein EZS28_020915 [Streblomastix strix]
MILYAEIIYTYAVRRHLHDIQVLFNFWNFLIYFRKNFKKGEAILKLMKRNHMTFLMKFIVYSYDKERVIGIGIVDKGNLNSENSIIFLQKLAFAQKNHNLAKESAIKFFEYVTGKLASCQILYDHVRGILQAESRARTTYEDLLTQQPQNVSVLKQYALLLYDIFRDEDSAEIVMSKALSIEKQNQGNESDIKQSKDYNDNHLLSPSIIGYKQLELEQLKLINEEETALLIVSEANMPMIQDSNNKQQMNQRQSVESKSSNQSSEDRNLFEIQSLIRKKKQKKKKGMNYLKSDDNDNVMSEIHNADIQSSNLGSFSQINKRFFNILLLWMIVGHTISIISLVVSCIVRLAPLFISCLYQDLVCSFNYRGLNDGEAEFFISWDQICEKLLLYSDQITSTLENIYSIMADTSQWEDSNIIVQVFDIRLDLEGSEYYSTTQSSSQTFPTIVHDEPVQYSNQQYNTTLIRTLTQHAQKSREMANQPYRQEVGSGDLPHITNINFYSDIAYVCFNSIQPVFAGC